MSPEPWVRMHAAAVCVFLVAAMILGEIPNVTKTYHVLGIDLTGETLHRVLTYAVFLLVLMPLIFGNGRGL